MFLGLGVEWSLRRAPNMPLLEFSATIAKINISNIHLIYLSIGLEMVKIVQDYGGLIIPPFGDPPKDKCIFFTVQFKSNEELEHFLNDGWNRAG